MCAGVRDAVALGWRLNGIPEGRFGADVLDSYTSERLEHAKHHIDFSQELGKIICISDPERQPPRRGDEGRPRGAEQRAGADRRLPPGDGVWVRRRPRRRASSRCRAWSRRTASATASDQAVGQGWMVIGLGADPAEALTPASGMRSGFSKAGP